MKTTITRKNTMDTTPDYFIDADDDIFVYQSEEEMYVLVATAKGKDTFCSIGDWYNDTDLEGLVPFRGTLTIEIP